MDGGLTSSSPPPASPTPPASRLGRNGPRSATPSLAGGSQAGDDHRDPGSPSKTTSKSIFKDSGESRSQKRPRGNLPPAPVFNGDRKTNPKCFKIWIGKVDSYVEIARKIIDEDKIGLRLHAALEGKAAEYLEDVPAKTFGGVDGWRILMRVLQEKFDEPQVHKIGSAMKSFFKMQLGTGNHTLREAADLLDKAHRDCRDTGLDMPDAVLI